MTERMVVNYYRPTFIENALRIRQCSHAPFHTLYSKTGIGHTASVAPHYSANGTGVPFISGKAIQNNEMLVSKAEV